MLIGNRPDPRPAADPDIEAAIVQAAVVASLQVPAGLLDQELGPVRDNQDLSRRRRLDQGVDLFQR